MSLRNSWNHWKIGTLFFAAVTPAVNAVDHTDTAQSAKQSSTIVKFQNDKSRKCITVEKPGKGKFILQFDCNKPGVANRWIKTSSPEAPYFTLKVRSQNRDWCIGVPGGNPNPDIELRMFECDGKANQKWKIDGGWLKNYDQLCVGVDQAGVEDGDILKQFKCRDNSNQKWRLIQ